MPRYFFDTYDGDLFLPETKESSLRTLQQLKPRHRGVLRTWRAMNSLMETSGPLS